MNAVETLRALAEGRRPAKGLLHTCRLEALGSSAYGEDGVAELFGLAGVALSAEAAVIEDAGHVAIFDGETALFADIAEGGVARIWLLCAADLWPAEPRIDVPSDPDLAQARGDIFFAASDFPSLAADGVPKLRLAGQALTRDSREAEWHDSRPRAFAIRAFGDAAEGVALFAVSRLAGAPMRRAGFTYALARWTRDGLAIVHDAAGEQALELRDWTPRVGA